MHHRRGIGRGGRTRGVALGLAMLLAGTVPLAAQSWIDIYGINNASTSHGYSAIEMPNGDMVSVGVEGGTITLLRTNANGGFITQENYPLTNFSGGIATDVALVPGTSDIVIVGETTEPGVGLIRGFVIRIGSVSWSKVISDPNHHIHLTGVTIAQNGNGAAAPGDVIYCGHWGLFSAPEGILGRLEGSDGDHIWFKSYDVVIAGGGSAGQLMDVTEVQLGPGVGDMVATGPLSGFTNVGGDFLSDVWVLRVDGDNGDATGANRGSALYSTVGNHSDYATSICQLRAGLTTGNFVIAGHSTGGASGASELLLLEVGADPCNLRSHALIHDNSGQGVVANDICEIPQAVGGNTGNLMVTGDRNNGPLGNLDVISLEVQRGTLFPAGQFHYYGDAGDDVGESISPVVNAPTTNGFVVTGQMRVRTFTPPWQVHDIFLMRIPNCMLVTALAKHVSTLMTTSCPPTVETPYNPVLNVSPEPVSLEYDGKHSICVPGPKPVTPKERNDGVMTSIASLEAFPSLVRRGASFTLDYTLTAPATAAVTVTDMTGRIIYRTGGERSEGHTTELIRTEGWSAGSYMIMVAAGGYSSTSRIIVTDH